MKIAENAVVDIDYVLTVDGEVVDESEEGQPLSYLHGANNIIPGLENALSGKSEGDSLEVTVSPEDGYGEYDPENVQELSKDDFEDEIEEGETYYAESSDGSILPFKVTKIEGDHIVADFNPELAGKTLHFQVTVRGVRTATPEELEHGHAHGEDDEHE